MKHSFYGVLLLIALFFAACSTSTDPGPDPGNGNGKDTIPDLNQQFPHGPSIKKVYDTGRGGVQITGIYFHQDSNEQFYQLKDEWIILQSDRNVSTRGWKIDASDGQQENLPDTIYRKLYIYTGKGPGYENDTIMIWDRGSRWIWNNTEPDTARVFDANGVVVDSATYKAKR